MDQREKKDKRPHTSYSVCKEKVENISLAVDLAAVRNGKSLRGASKEFHIPVTTLHDYMKRGRINVTKGTNAVNDIPAVQPCTSGRTTILTKSEESKLVHWCLYLSRIGYGVTKTMLITTIKKILDSEERKAQPGFHQRQHVFKNNTPGPKWFKLFLGRHPELSLRKPSSLGKERAIVSKASILKWFDDLKNEITECTDEGMAILKDPCRLFNCDESGFPLQPTPENVLAQSGAKHIYQLSTGEKSQITVLAAFNAAGDYVPPYIIYPVKRWTRDPLADSGFGNNAVYGGSEKGWMTSPNFFEWLVNVFDAFVVKKGIKKPVILFLDGHATHLSLEVAEEAAARDIILFCFPAHASHILQPADLTIFGVLKKNWKEALNEWQHEHIGSTVDKWSFASISRHAWEKYTVWTTNHSRGKASNSDQER